MSIKTITTENAPYAIGPYSQAVVCKETVYVSGQLGLNPATGDFADSTIQGQTRQALENLKAILKAAESDLDKVLSVEIFLTDMGNFSIVNEIYEEYFSKHKPARAAVEVRGLPKNGLIEIKCVSSL